MKYRIAEKKLLFLHHVATLPEGSLAKEILNVQTRMSLPGLAQECQEWLVRFKISEVKGYTKAQWKNIIKRNIRACNKDDILNQIKTSYKKLRFEDYKDEKFKTQPYLSTLNISDARTRFKIKSLMTPTIKMNFPSDPGYTRDLWNCPGCSEDGDVAGCRDTQSHVLICPGYAFLRHDIDLSQDKNLVRYFKEVIKIRLDSDCC